MNLLILFKNFVIRLLSFGFIVQFAHIEIKQYEGHFIVNHFTLVGGKYYKFSSASEASPCPGPKGKIQIVKGTEIFNQIA